MSRITLQVAALIPLILLAHGAFASGDDPYTLFFGERDPQLLERDAGIVALQMGEEWATSSDDAISLRLSAVTIESVVGLQTRLVVEVRNNTMADLVVRRPFRDLNPFLSIRAWKGDEKLKPEIWAIGCGSLGSSAFVTVPPGAVIADGYYPWSPSQYSKKYGSGDYWVSVNYDSRSDHRRSEWKGKLQTLPVKVSLPLSPRDAVRRFDSLTTE